MLYTMLGEAVRHMRVCLCPACATNPLRNATFELLRAKAATRGDNIIYVTGGHAQDGGYREAACEQVVRDTGANAR